jgi:acyl-CoA synthetase (AMP-forming)/AMP-acid ligase II
MTGDIARLDEDGFIWLVDRKKDVIITGGENIYPVEIEDFLQGTPRASRMWPSSGCPACGWAKSRRPSSR